MKFTPTLKVNGREFKLVKLRREAPMAVYRCEGLFMRVGKSDDLHKEVRERDKLKTYGFPIPTRYKKTKIDGDSHYYLEESMGRKHFTQIFGEKYKTEGEVSDRDFKDFIKIVKRFAEAQLKTAVKKKNFTEFANAIRIRRLKKILPKYASKIDTVYSEAKEKLSMFPFVLSHGDFNTHNLYKKGVIDFEGLFYGPAGYDIVSAIFTIEMIDVKGNEFPVRFTQEQKNMYYEVFDNLYLENGLPRLSDYAKYFEFCRAVWLTTNSSISDDAKEYRKEFFIRNFLSRDLRKEKTAL
jgi:thiamine kinase-like enzyme